MPHTLGIDIGTTSITALVFDTDSGTVLNKATTPNNSFITAAAGHREQDPEMILKSLQTALDQLANGSDQLKNIDGISVTGQMHSCVLLDKKLRPVTPLITWQDERALHADAAGRTLLDKFLDMASANKGMNQGMIPAPGYMGTTLFALKESGTLPDKARYAAMSHDWIVSELTGNTGQPATDPSFAQSSGIFLVREKQWNSNLIKATGLDNIVLPEITEPGTQIGVTGKSGLPLKTGIPIFTGLGDNQASVMGSVTDFQKTVLLNIGTGGQVSIIVDDFKLMPGIDTRVFIDNMYLLVGASLCGGRAYSIFRNFIKEIGREIFNTTIEDDALYEKIEACSKPATKLLCKTLFAGTRLDPDQRGEFSNVSESNFTPGDFACAVMEGMIQEFFDYYTTMDTKRSILAGSGNGIRKNMAVRRHAERIFNMPMTIPDVEEEAALGAAIIAAKGFC